MTTWLAVGAVLVGNIAALMGMVPIATILPTVAESFGLDIQAASFVMTAFLLMIAALVLIAGRLGDLLGFQRVFRAGLLLYAVGGLLCGAALDFWQLVVARAVAGVGAAMLTGTSAAIITAVIDPARRGRALSLLTITGPIGGIIGVGLAPLILETLSWRWVFFMVVPLALVAFVLARHVPSAPPASGRRVDAPGGLLLFLALVAISLSFNHFHEGAETFEDGWAWHIPMQGLATALLIGFLWVERRVAQPLLDVRVLRHRAVAISVGCHGVVHMTMLAAMFLTPFFLQRGLGLTPGHVAMLVVVTNTVSTGSALVGGWLWDRAPSALLRPISLGMLMAGLLVTAALLPSLTFGSFLALQLVLGLGMGVANTLNYTIALGQAPSDQRGFVTGLLETTRQMGHTLAVVLAAAVLGGGRPDGAALVPAFQTAWLVFGLIAAGGTALAVLPQQRPRSVSYQPAAIGHPSSGEIRRA